MKIAAESPNSVSLAAPIASSKPLTGASTATGPKISSRISALSRPAPVSTVGSTQKPASGSL